jgi:hypothetical protein
MAAKAKRPRIATDVATVAVAASNNTSPCKWLDQLQLLLPIEEPTMKLLPNSLTKSKTKISLHETKHLFDHHGFRSNLVTSPRPALSIYVDSCNVDHSEEFECSFMFSNGRAFLLAMLGMHPEQEELEHAFKTYIQPMYIFKVFLLSLRRASPTALKDIMKGDEVDKIFEDYTLGVQELTNYNPCKVDFTTEAATMISYFCKVDTRFRVDQLQNEYRRVKQSNSTFSNALLQLFLDFHENVIQDILYQSSPGSPAYERITIFLHDPLESSQRPQSFIFLPALHTVLTKGLDALVEDAVQCFWHHVMKLGYVCMPPIKLKMSHHLRTYFMTGLVPSPYAPLSLKAHFQPTYPLSLYLWGCAGSGKSSLVRVFPLALQATIADLADPELSVQFVKQTLNKPQSDLDLELTARPNNNDMSLMSIIQSRRMTLAQSKPGLVVVHMEEMPSSASQGDPNQVEVCRLLSQRFSGRNSDYVEETGAPPRNSTRRGICKDASLVVLFTSNYELHEQGELALKKILLFSNLVTMEMPFLSGKDRKDFALCYMQQCIFDRVAQLHPNSKLILDIDYGEGDIRLLVRHIRMLAHFVFTLLKSDRSTSTIIVRQSGNRCILAEGSRSIELKIGFMGISFATVPQVFDARTVEVMQRIDQKEYAEELYQVLECFFAKALAPAVVVSNNGQLIAAMVQAVARCNGVRCLQSIRVSECKMMRSLYDARNAYNLRDEILREGRGSYCAIELICGNQDAQLCIRELIEDSPSMTAFSTCNSALYKAGLFFGVHVVGKVSPEVRSRASLIL